MFTGLLQKANRPLMSAQRISLIHPATHSFAHLNQGLVSVAYRLKSTMLKSSSTAASTGSKSVFELGAQLERQSEIIKNIKQAKKDILEKQSLGRQLALNVAYRKTDLEDHRNSTQTASPQVGLLEKQQRYHMFVDKMLQLYKSEKRLAKKRNQAYARMELSPVQSLTPIKACLFEYSRLSTNGFNCGVLAESLKRLNQAVTAVGNNPLTFNDYTLNELDQSWRLDKLTEDLKFGLDPNPNVFFSPYNLAEVSRQLGYLGYKNTEVMPRWFDKIDSMLTKTDTQKYIETAQVSFSQAMFGGQKGFVPRHYIYQGFSDSEEFKSHVETLLMYEHDKETALTHRVNTGEKGSLQLREVKRAALQLIEAANEVKDMQQEMEAAVRSVRTQYQKLKEAHDQHAFLQENKYIQLDLLELQELLIKAGYLQPDEQPVNQEVQVGALGMDAAVEVFYELVLNYHPEVLSPQYDSFYDAVQELPQRSRTLAAAKGDRYADLSLHTLSSTLIGIEKQAMSFRRDIKDDDYPTEFYQKLLNAEEEWLNRQEHSMDRSLNRIGQKCLAQYVRMERTYLNGWRTFFERTKDIPTRMEEMLKKNVSQEDCYSALRALNVCRFEAKDLRDKISSKFATLNKKKRCTDRQALVDGIVGLAGSSYKIKSAGLMVKRIIEHLLEDAPKRRIGQSIAPNVRIIDTLTFLQAAELLQGLTTPGMAIDQPKFNQCVEILCDRINQMSFEMIHNELKFDEFETLYTAYVNLKFSEVKAMRDIHKSHFINEALVRAFEQKSYTELQYNEAGSAKYDPLKPRVIGGFTQSLVKADLNHLHIMQENETQGMFREMYPFTPDVLMGYEGQKVGIFVLNNDQVMRDSLQPDGFSQAKMRLVESAHSLNKKNGTSRIKNVALPVRRVVDADLQNHKLSLRADFNIDTFLEETGLADHIKESRIDTHLLSKFGSSIFEKAEDRLNGSPSGAFEEFLVQLLHVMRIREKMDSVFEQEQVLSAIDELKLEMLKLLMMEATLSIHEKNLVRESLPGDIKSFENLITQGLVEPITQTQIRIKDQLGQDAGQQKGASFWQGIRQEVEVPPLIHDKVSDVQPKSILPEILNQKFLWYEGYHHYSDWEQKMSQVYDQFNLLELPQGSKDDPKFSFLEREFKRRIPRGIFPCAKSPRAVLRPPNAIEASSRDSLSLNDSFSKYERSPMQTMIKNELERNSELIARGVPSEVTSITNLQNIKHSLKSDATDHQICDWLFNKLSFTDKLIEEHLGLQRQGSATYVQRDPESFRQFLNQQQSQEGVVSPYDHFYIREAVRKGNPEEIYAKIQELDNIHPPLPKNEYDAKMGELNKKLEDCLINYKNSIEDKFNLSKALDNHLEVTIDVSSLTSVKKRNQNGLSATDLEIAPEIFLQKQRCRAESNLIKARIVYKMHSDVPLSESEKKYMTAWMEKAAETSTLLPNADVLVPQHPSSLSLADALSPDDFYAFNSLSRVSIQNEHKKEIALNDLVLELSHFVDAETVRKVELSLLEDTLKKKWVLADDFSLVDRRNKEIDLVMHEMEEVTWRTAALFDAREKKSIEDMVFIDRGHDAFENAFLEMDRQSFSAFFDEANNFDSRVNLLENWMCRKDEEVRNRVNLPTPTLAKSDQALFAKYDAPLKKARESLLGQILTIDEFGKDRLKKAYGELTSRELHLLIESLCVRLNLFQQKYPAFLPQVVKAVMEHPNLANSDRYQMEAFCKLFELDWRGDSSLESREQFMMSNPVYMKETDRSSTASIGAITNESVLGQIRQACKPFLPTLIAKMRQAK